MNKELNPTYYQIVENFIAEIDNDPRAKLPAKDAAMARLAVLLGCQGKDAFKQLLKDTLEQAILTPVEVQEIVYQATDYLGYGRVCPFIKTMDKVFEKQGIQLPLPEQAVTTKEDRFEKGLAAQVEIFGEHMKEAVKQGPVNEWLAANCFGDYYTRTGLTLAQREMITFCFLEGQGGCENQLRGHIQGNIHMGNDLEYLKKIVMANIPYVGYPRSLNAMACIQEAAK